MIRNPRVIIIDQDQTGRDDIQKMLALSGFTVLGEAGYGVEAVSLAKDTEPDIVVISLEEPFVRALQTVQAMADLLPQSPIIGYSSSHDASRMRKAMQAGVKDYLSTPLDEEEITQSIHSALNLEERRRARIAGDMEEPVASGIVITVFGAKGGIGKSTISTNLAASLVRNSNQSVVLVDLDTRFGDVAILLDVPAERSIANLAMPEEEITRELVQECIFMHKTGVAVLPAPIRPTDWRNVHAGHIERVVTLLAQTYDYVILDTPGTFNDVVARSLEMATLVLLVATVDMASLKDTLLAIDMLRSWNFPQEKLMLVINSTNEASVVRTQEVSRMLGREVFWSIPYDRSISAATQLGMPAVVTTPQSRASESMTGMAYALSGVRRQQDQVQKEAAKGSLISRFLGQKSEEKSEEKSGIAVE
jgi:pilus assembly protein CpaE